MPRNARTVAAGLPYHITQRGTNREKVFFSVADRHLYLRLIRENLSDAGVKVLAYCLMSNHVHFVVVPEREDSLAVLFARANGRYAQVANARKGRSGHLWQARFFSCALSEQRLWSVLGYVEANPCRAGMVERPEEYRWSSAAVHLTGVADGSGILDLLFYQQAGGMERWQQVHENRASEEDLTKLRRCTYSGRPFGDESFLSALEGQFHRRWRRFKLEAESAFFVETAQTSVPRSEF